MKLMRRTLLKFKVCSSAPLSGVSSRKTSLRKWWDGIKQFKFVRIKTTFPMFVNSQHSTLSMILNYTWTQRWPESPSRFFRSLVCAISQYFMCVRTEWQARRELNETFLPLQRVSICVFLVSYVKSFQLASKSISILIVWLWTRFYASTTQERWSGKFIRSKRSRDVHVAN